MNRRDFLLSGAATAALLVSAAALLRMGGTQDARAAETFEVTKTEAEWKAILSPAAFDVLRKEGTEYPGTSPLLNEHRKGIFACAGCDLPVYPSETKFDSGTGWPSFWQEIPNGIGKTEDRSLGMTRTEVHLSLIHISTVSKKAWRAFLDAMIAENMPVLIVGSTRADDIVRDADILHLYRKAGVIRWLLGMENTDEQTLQLIRKGGSTSSDREAIRLLRLNGILSMATWVAGFEDEGFSDLWRGFRQLVAYDPDQIQALYVTPHRWTPFFKIARDRKVIQQDVRLWDYKHQVLKMTRLKPWMLFFLSLIHI